MFSVAESHFYLSGLMERPKTITTCNVDRKRNIGGRVRKKKEKFSFFDYKLSSCFSLYMYIYKVGEKDHPC